MPQSGNISERINAREKKFLWFQQLTKTKLTMELSNLALDPEPVQFRT
jgi:hypothetical protein